MTDTRSEARKPTFRDVAEDWFRSKRNCRTSTLAAWRVHLDVHLLPELGDRLINQIDVATIERLRDKLAEPEPFSGARPLAPQTVNKVLTTATAVFKLAVRRRCITHNPALDAERLRRAVPDMTPGSMLDERHSEGEAVREEDVLSTDEVRRLLAEAEPGYYRTLFLTATLTGARSGELLGLSWDDIDLGAGKISIRRSLSWAKVRGDFGEPSFRFNPPKTAAGYRTLPAPPELVAALRSWKITCPPSEHNLVFPGATGKPAHRSNVLRSGLYPALRRAKLRRVDIHSLRHGFASALIERGAPVTEVQYLLGHSKPDVTLRVYSHWFKKTRTTTVADLARVVCTPSGAEPTPAAVASGSKMVAEAPSRRGRSCVSPRKISAPGAIRTHGPRIRNPVLYPPELRGRVWKTNVFNSGTLRALPTPEVTADTPGR